MDEAARVHRGSRRCGGVAAEIKAAIADLQTRQTAAAAAETENAKQLATLVDAQAKQNARSQDLDSREAALGRRAVELDVASTSIAEREGRVSAREVAVSDAEAKVAEQSAALQSKIAAYRQALAG